MSIETRVGIACGTGTAQRGSLGQVLRGARRAAGLTRAALAQRTGLTLSAVARHERGTSSPTVETLSRLAEALESGFAIGPGSGLTVYTMSTPTLDKLRWRRDEILRIAAAHGASNVRVFGSVARGDARPDSDIDFLVDLDRKRTLFDLSGLILDLQDALGHKVDVVQIAKPSRAGEHILREAVPL